MSGDPFTLAHEPKRFKAATGLMVRSSRVVHLCVARRLSNSGRYDPAYLSADAGVVLLDLGVGVLLGLLQRRAGRHAVEHLLLGFEHHVAHTLVVADDWARGV